MLSPVKLRVFVKAVIVKVKAGAELDAVINSYTNLDDEEKEQLREAVLKELQPEEEEPEAAQAVENVIESN
ncbi:hypothetical protein [Phascolarctobacterium sp.]|uniref:hypothetical protein n=1 Tax=Phascolarctobacterium sp. TaxID=2049039 RepID=UPI003864DB14